MDLSVIIPAYNEESLIGPCLSAIITGHSQKAKLKLEIIVIANACQDKTAENARAFEEAAREAGIALTVIETAIGGKAHALNLAERTSLAPVRVYLDADVVCGPGMIAALFKTLSAPDARYASGDIVATSGGGFFAECYGRVWSNLPFVKSGVSGCGLYAVNAAGRQRWDVFPQIHSDDKFVRLHFAPQERFKVETKYRWPLPKSLWELVTVRSRWCRGNAEFARDFQHLLANDESRKIDPLWALGFFIKHPLSSLIFAGIYVAAKFRALIYSNSLISAWERSR